MMVKNQKFFLIVDFDSSNYEFRYTELNATKETAALSNVQFLKNQEKLPFREIKKTALLNNELSFGRFSFFF